MKYGSNMKYTDQLESASAIRFYNTICQIKSVINIVKTLQFPCVEAEMSKRMRQPTQFIDENLNVAHLHRSILMLIHR